MLLTIASTILVLGVLIFVHELGHFLAAKAVGIGVPRFSIGFGPPTPLRFKRGETEYLVSWLPLGGYVKMASREEQESMAALEGGELEETFPPEKLFENKPLWARILAISAGVIMNVLFAWATYFCLTLALGRAENPSTLLARADREALPAAAERLADVPHGTAILRVNGEDVASWNDVQAAILSPRSERLVFEFDGPIGRIDVEIPGTDAQARADVVRALDWLPEIGSVESEAPADVAGIEAGDVLRAIDGEPLLSWDDLVTRVQESAGRELALTIDRGGTLLEIPATPAEKTVKDPETGADRTIGQLGISPLVYSEVGLWGAVRSATGQTWDNADLVLVALQGMFTGKVSVRELGGPILIGQASGEFARRGLVDLLLFMALLSVNLAILNLLPIPVLDGGHLVFLIFEGLRGGRPLALEVRQRLIQFGLVVILGIMVLALGNDLLRLVGW